MLRIPSPGQLCNPTPRLDSASRATGHRRRETQSDAGTPGRPRRRRPWGAECHGDDALSAGPVFGRPQGPRLPRAAAGPRSPHVAAVIVLAPYPSAPPPQPPTPFPGPPDRGAAEGSHAHARTHACAHVPPWPRRTEGAEVSSRRCGHSRSAVSRRASASPAAAGRRASGRAGRTAQLVPRRGPRILPPQLLGEGGGRCLRRAASSPPPPRLPLRRRPLPPPPLRLLLLAVPAAVRRARRWPVGRATWIT